MSEVNNGDPHTARKAVLHEVESEQTTQHNRRLSGSERRREIVEACVRAIAYRGFSSASIREIARRSGVSLSTLLYHFSNKHEILAASLEMTWRIWRDGAKDVLDRPGRPVDRLECLIEWMFTAPGYQYLWRVWIAFVHESAYDARLSKTVVAATAEWDEMIAEVINEAVDMGELAGDPFRIGQELSTMMDGLGVNIYGQFGRWTVQEGVELCRTVLQRYRG